MGEHVCAEGVGEWGGTVEEDLDGKVGACFAEHAEGDAEDGEETFGGGGDDAAGAGVVYEVCGEGADVGDEV